MAVRHDRLGGVELGKSQLELAEWHGQRAGQRDDVDFPRLAHVEQGEVVGARGELAGADRVAEAAERGVVDESGHGFRTRVGRVLERAEPAAQRVIGRGPADRGGADAGEHLDRLGRHDRADHRDGGGQHPADLAAGHGAGGGRHREQVAIGGALRRPAEPRLPAVLRDGTPDDRDAAEPCRVIREVAGREVVAAVDDEVEPGEQPERVRAAEAFVDRAHPHLGIEGRHLLSRGFGLAVADIRHRMHGLAVQVAELDTVVVHDRQSAHAGAREGRDDARPEPARPDDQHAGGGEPPLAVGAEARQGLLARVAGIHGSIFAPPCALSAGAVRCRSPLPPSAAAGVDNSCNPGPAAAAEPGVPLRSGHPDPKLQELWTGGAVCRTTEVASAARIAATNRS